MWNDIRTPEELEQFLGMVQYFHDSCIKEMHYCSGAYVTEELSMHPINDQRVLRVIIQRQFHPMSVIELQFSGLKYLRLNPVDPRYTCEILDATMFLQDKLIYWCDMGGLSETDVDSYDGTVICACALRWREIDGGLGKSDYEE